MTTVNVSQPTVVVDVLDPEVSVGITSPQIVVSLVENQPIEINLVGLGGGTSGSSERLTVTGTAGEDLSGDRVVIRDSDGLMRYADHANLDHAVRPMRLSLTAVMQGDEGEFIAIGEHTASGWAWPMGGLLFLNGDGFMQLTPPVTGFVMQVGCVIDADSIYFAPDDPTILP